MDNILFRCMLSIHNSADFLKLNIYYYENEYFLWKAFICESCEIIRFDIRLQRRGPDGEYPFVRKCESLDVLIFESEQCVNGKQD